MALPYPLVSPKMFARNSEARKEYLQKIKCKTYVMAGSSDAISQDNTDFIAANIPDSVEMILEGESHTSHIVHNSKIAEIILELAGKM